MIQKLYDINDVASIVSLSVSTINRGVIDGTFPKHVMYRGNRRWKSSAIEQWINSLGENDMQKKRPGPKRLAA